MCLRGNEHNSIDGQISSRPFQANHGVTN